jgi:hypothetical protein
VVAEAASHPAPGRNAILDQDREVAARAHQRAVGDLLDAVARNPPLLSDVGGAHLARLADRLFAERIEV